jgi:uncharacterized membrane protein
MTAAAVALVLLSALLHAVWTFFNKGGSEDRWAFFFAQGIATIVLWAPLSVWRWGVAGHVGPGGWMWVSASVVMHAGYAVYLLKSFDAGDLSVAYPLSRTAPVLVAVWDMLTARADLTAAGFVGAISTGAGALILQFPALRARGGRAVLGENVTRYALITAVFIAAFTVIDKQGVQRMDPLLYLYILTVGEFSLIGFRLGLGAFPRIVNELRTHTRSILFASLLGPFGYLLILWVLGTAPASYVLGLRQTSILFGVLLGRFVLGEGETRYRLAGAGVIAAGSVLIAAAG